MDRSRLSLAGILRTHNVVSSRRDFKYTMKNNRNDLMQSAETLASEIDTLIVNKLGDKSSSRTNKIMDTGWSRIPNCGSMIVHDATPDLELKKVGLKVNKIDKLRIDITPYKNHRLNRYMIFQIKRLKKHVRNGPLFWHITWLLCRKSVAFRVSAINHVLSGWERKLPFFKVLNITRNVSKIFNEWKTDFNYIRSYIPKGDTFRPLGIPTLEWRVALHMFSNFLYIFLQPWILESQHGFVPKRGVLTAWKEIIDKVLDAKWIYECDLKQFFPSVETEVVIDQFFKYGMPVHICDWFRLVTHQQPRLPTDKKLDESQVELYNRINLNIDFNRGSRQFSSFLDNKGLGSPANLVGTYWVTNDYEPFNNHYPMILNYVSKNRDEWLEWGKSENHIPEYNIGKLPYFDTYVRKGVLTNLFQLLPYYVKGFPQGAPSSPIASISILNSFLSQQKSVSYADDPIFYGDKEFVIRDRPHVGINLHPDKSGWVKRDGIWIKELKFLGIIYDPVKKSIRAASNPLTSKIGSTLELTLDHLDKILSSGSERVMQLSIEELEDKYTSSWKKLLRTKIFGLLMSRLQNGSFNLENLEQDFRMEIGNHSWIEKMANKKGLLQVRNEFNIFNSSSYACYSLAGLLKLYQAKKTGTYRSRPIRFDDFKLIRLSAVGRKRHSFS